MDKDTFCLITSWFIGGGLVGWGLGSGSVLTIAIGSVITVVFGAIFVFSGED